MACVSRTNLAVILQYEALCGERRSGHVAAQAFEPAPVAHQGMILMMAAQIPLDYAQLAEFCRKWGVAELSLFGSVLRDDFGPDSDVDVLVLFKPETRIGLMGLATMQFELEDMVGRKVDLVPKNGLKPRIRDSVLRSSEVVFQG